MLSEKTIVDFDPGVPRVMLHHVVHGRGSIPRRTSSFLDPLRHAGQVTVLDHKPQPCASHDIVVGKT